MKNGEHLSPASGASELFPVQEEKESFHGEGSVFNVTFSGNIEKPGMKNENGTEPLRMNANSDGTVLEVSYHSQPPA